MTGSLWCWRAASRCRRQCSAVTAVRPTSRTAAAAHTTVANARSPANCSGRLAAAVATMPVPMIDVYQFGVT